MTRALLTAPRLRDWGEFVIALVIVAGVAVPAGLATGLLHLAPRSAGEIARTSLIVLFIPAAGEELPFRALMIPGRTEPGAAVIPILGSTLAFTAWHVVETLWQPQHRALFLRPDFLAWAAWLGIWCAILRRRSGSIWTAVTLHWATVVAWIGWLGGPGF